MKTTKKNIARLKKKMADPHKLFKKAAIYYEKKMGVDKIFFLLPSKKTDIFMSKHPYQSKLVLMPIYINEEISCYLIIKGKINNHWLKTNTIWLKEVKKTIEYNLRTILQYNQALERIIRWHCQKNKNNI